jgi:hypothetical protein
MWCFFDDIDSYVYDKEGLGTGVHIIHFPDSVMDKCYSCVIDYLDFPPDSMKLFIAYSKMVLCAVNNANNVVNVIT